MLSYFKKGEWVIWAHQTDHFGVHMLYLQSFIYLLFSLFFFSLIFKINCSQTNQGFYTKYNKIAYLTFSMTFWTWWSTISK